MSTESGGRENLPETVVDALWQGKKIEAIKLLREARHIDLKESKDAVDAYVRTQPALQQKFAAAQTEAKRGLLWIIIVLALTAAGVYYLLISPR